MSSRESSINPTAAEVTSSSAPKSDPAAEDVADTLAPEEKCKEMIIINVNKQLIQNIKHLKYMLIDFPTST